MAVDNVTRSVDTNVDEFIFSNTADLHDPLWQYFKMELLNAEKLRKEASKLKLEEEGEGKEEEVIIW